MYVKIIADEAGCYRNDAGERFFIMTADWARSQTWEWAESKEAAVVAYGLIFDPKEEE